MKILQMSEALDFEEVKFKNKVASFLNNRKWNLKKDSLRKHLSGNASLAPVNLTKPEHFYGLEAPNAKDIGMGGMDFDEDDECKQI